jgi:hypothetical protein
LVDGAREVDIVDNAGEGCVWEVMNGMLKDGLYGKAEEEGAKDAALARAASRRDVDRAVPGVNEEIRWLAVGPVTEPPDGLKLRGGEEALEHEMAVEGVEAILEVEVEDHVGWVVVNMGLEEMNG